MLDKQKVQELHIFDTLGETFTFNDVTIESDENFMAINVTEDGKEIAVFNLAHVMSLRLEVGKEQ